MPLHKKQKIVTTPLMCISKLKTLIKFDTWLFFVNQEKPEESYYNFLDYIYYIFLLVFTFLK